MKARGMSAACDQPRTQLTEAAHGRAGHPGPHRAANTREWCLWCSGRTGCVPRPRSGGSKPMATWEPRHSTGPEGRRPISEEPGKRGASSAATDTAASLCLPPSTPTAGASPLAGRQPRLLRRWHPGPQAGGVTARAWEWRAEARPQPADHRQPQPAAPAASRTAGRGEPTAWGRLALLSAGHADPPTTNGNQSSATMATVG